jgi:hypothetical protein
MYIAWMSSGTLAHTTEGWFFSGSKTMYRRAFCSPGSRAYLPGLAFSVVLPHCTARRLHPHPSAGSILNLATKTVSSQKVKVTALEKGQRTLCNSGRSRALCDMSDNCSASDFTPRVGIGFQ